MPRQKKIDNEIVENESQEIIAPLIDASGPVGLEVNNVETVFQKKLKKFGVYKDGEFLEEVDENSSSIETYLTSNKSELESRVYSINEIISDPDTLIFFHEGKQNRTYMSFSAYYGQNGLAPKNISIDTWAKYYRNTNPLLTDEEIALHKFGNLPYSFVILQEEE